MGLIDPIYPPEINTMVVAKIEASGLSKLRGLGTRTGNPGVLRRPVRPQLEALESRVVQATSAFDPAFGQGGIVLGQVDTGTGPSLSDASAAAIQPDGKVVVVGSVTRPTPFVLPATNPTLAAVRYNPDGSLDPSFGSNGQVDISLPSGYSTVFMAPHNLVIEPDGSIAFAAAISGPPNDPSTATLVVQLTTAGQLDARFGTGGETILAEQQARMAAIARQADGSLVVAGGAVGETGLNLAVARLTPAGVLDTAFGQGGYVLSYPVGPNKFFVPPGITDPGEIEGSSSPAVAVAITGSGQILVASNVTVGSILPVIGDFNIGLLGRLNPDGSFDQTFGGAGYRSTGSGAALADMALQPDGRIILAGNSGYVRRVPGDGQDFVQRYLADGTVDPSFKFLGPNASATDLPSRAVNYNSLALQPDGKILVGGTSSNAGAGIYLSSSTTGLVDRFQADGASDTSFGIGGRLTIDVPGQPAPSGDRAIVLQSVNGLAATADGRIVTAGSARSAFDDGKGAGFLVSALQSVVTRILPDVIIPPARRAANDYDGDGKSDIAAQLEAAGVFAYRPSAGAPDVLTPFGTTGLGQVLPAPGDYDGDGRTDVAGYLPEYGVLAYRSSSTSQGAIIPFGLPGTGQSIPAPGDYDGDGRTDVAAYLPGLGILAYRPSSGGPDVLVPFGIPGPGQSIPAPGDYDGDGKADPAVYLPALGVLAYRPSSGGADVLVPFGIPGAGQSIPAAGDYDGDGKADPAVYLPSYGVFGYRPSGGGADVIVPFGLAGPGASIPAPGDYDGDGKTDVAAYLPALGLFAIRPSSGGADTVQQFGAIGSGQTVPAASISYAQQSASGPVASAAMAVHDLALTDDLLPPELAHLRRKRASTA